MRTTQIKRKTWTARQNAQGYIVLTLHGAQVATMEQGDEANRHAAYMSMLGHQTVKNRWFSLSIEKSMRRDHGSK